MASWEDYVASVRTLHESLADEAGRRAQIEHEYSEVLAETERRVAARMAEHTAVADQLARVEEMVDQLLERAGTSRGRPVSPPTATLAEVRNGISDADAWVSEAGPRHASLLRTHARLTAATPGPPSPRPVNQPGPTSHRQRRSTVVITLALVGIVALVVVILFATHAI